MKDARVARLTIRTAIATCGGLLATFLAFFVPWLVTYFRTGGDFADLGSIGALCGISAVWVIAVVMPACDAAEAVLIRRLGLRWWAHVPLLAAFFFAIVLLVSIFIAEVFGMGLSVEPDWPSLPLAFGMHSALLGTVYWCLFRASDRLARRWIPSSA